MKVIAGLIVAFLLLCWTMISRAGDLEQNNVDKAWSMYKATTGFVAKSDDDYTRRKANFAKTHAMILKNNANKNATFMMAHNKFSIMDDEEKKSYLDAHPKDETWPCDFSDFYLF